MLPNVAATLQGARGKAEHEAHSDTRTQRTDQRRKNKYKTIKQYIKINIKSEQ
jgi:hypothetical protein